MLVDILALEPRLRGEEISLAAGVEERLTAWQQNNLQLAWATRGRPWEVEAQVIALLQPPLNAAGNQAHPYFARVGQALRSARAGTRGAYSMNAGARRSSQR
jgi:hypothetical protein